MTAKINPLARAVCIAASGVLAAAPAAAAERGPRGVFKTMEQVSNAGFENFGTYAIRIDQLGVGPDGDFQAVLTVRNKSAGQAGLVASHIRMTLINADNEPRVSFGDLYQPDATGPAGSLPKLERTIVLQTNEQTRLRLVFFGSKGFVPRKVRVRDNADKEATVTYALD